MALIGTNELNELLATLLTGAVVVLTERIRHWINSKINNENLHIAVNHLDDISQAVVLELEQTLRSRFDGKLSEAERELIKSAAIQKIKSVYSDELIKSLGKHNVDIDNLISSKIESVLYTMKQRTVQQQGGQP